MLEFESSASLTLDSHIKEITGLWNLSHKSFKNFYKKFAGESLTDSEVFEARILLINMILSLLKNDCEVILDEIKKENPYL